MFAHFPDPYPDELFYSICARLDDQLSLPKPRILYKLIFDNESSYIRTIDFPNDLPAFIRKLPQPTSYTVQSIIQNHTLFPYHAPFYSLEEYISRPRRKYTSIRIWSSSHEPAITIPSYLRFCPLCCNADYQQYGTTYWRRLHQLPGMFGCLIHTVYLVDSNVSKQRYIDNKTFVSARSVFTQYDGTPKYIPDRALCLLYYIVHNSEWLLRSNYDKQWDNVNMEMVLIKLDDFIKHRMNLEDYQISRLFLDSYSQELQHMIGVIDKCGIYINALTNLLHRRFDEIFPFLYLVILYIQGIDIRKFLSYQMKYTFGLGPWPCLHPPCPNYKKFCIQYVKYTLDLKTPVPIGIFTCPQCHSIYERQITNITPYKSWKKSNSKRFKKAKV